MADSGNWPEAPCSLQQMLCRAEENFNAAGLYFGHGTDNAWDEAVMLALHSLELPWNSDAQVLQQSLSEQEVDGLVTLFECRMAQRVPAAYLTGKAVFAGMEFAVTPEVLVPRSPFAELIENAYTPWLPGEPARVLDLCTGCGCIGIATAAVFPRARVDLSDISAAAARVAEQNIRTHHLQDRVRAMTGDLFSSVADQRYDLIVCNPPYVDACDLANMPAEYRAEPELALASGDDGLDFCRRLLWEAPNHLTEHGVLIVELGNSWQALEQAYPRVPFLWVEFARGGHGVFVMTAGEMQHYTAELNQSWRDAGD